MNKPTDKPIECRARRHMGAEFHIYDYMVAACKSDEDYKPGDALIFHGRRFRICNAVNRSTTQVDESLAKLEDAGWIISLQGPRGERKQRRTARGRHTTIEYRVLEHEEYEKAHECPGPRYDEETGEPIEPGRMAPAIERARIKEMFENSGFVVNGDPVFTEEFLDFVAEGIAIKQGRPSRARKSLHGKEDQ